MNEQILKAINVVLEKKGRPHVNVFDPNLRLREDIGMDSLDLAELTVRVEAFSGVDIFEKGIVRTLGEIQARADKR